MEATLRGFRRVERSGPLLVDGSRTAVGGQEWRKGVVASSAIPHAPSHQNEFHRREIKKTTIKFTDRFNTKEIRRAALPERNPSRVNPSTDTFSCDRICRTVKTACWTTGSDVREVEAALVR